MHIPMSVTVPLPAALEAAPSLPDPVAAVRERIKELALLEVPPCGNDAMCQYFADLFPKDIPPVDHLPDNIVHCFRLKDANMVIAQRQYTCPKCYHEAWKTLL